MEFIEITKIIEEVARLYVEDKLSAIKISKLLDIKISAVYKYLISKNISRRSNSANSRKYSCDHFFFNKIDTEEKAYWLGFIYADGYITGKSMGITLGEKDRDHLIKFSQSIKSTYPIHTYEYNGYTSTIGCRVILRSDQIVEDLIRNGCYYNKSLILKWPTHIPSNLINHFIRGYMDGDGSISICTTSSRPVFRLRFEGTREFLNSLMSFFSIDLKLQKRNDDLKNSYTLDIGGNINVLSKLDIIYKNSSIFLERKHQRYKLLQSLCSVMGK